MWIKLQECFNELEEEYKIPYSRQGSYEADEELPKDFYTFWNASTEYESFYNNRPSKCIWSWNIFYYTSSPENIYNGLDIFLKKAIEKGFIVDGAGRDIMSDEPNYFGRYLTIKYIEEL